MTKGVHKIYREDNQPFTMVPNDAVRNPQITPNAFRLLAYLMSHREGYSLTYGQIERQTTLKRYAINAAIELLTRHGYLEVRRSKLPNGQYGPKDWVIKNPTTVDDSTVDSSHMEPFQSGTANGHKKNTSREEQSFEKTTSRGPTNADDYEPTPEFLQKLAVDFPGVRLDTELEKFRDHHMAAGSKWSNWDRAFRKWIRQASEWSRDARAARALAEEDAKLRDWLNEEGN